MRLKQKLRRVIAFTQKNRKYRIFYKLVSRDSTLANTLKVGDRGYIM